MKSNIIFLVLATILLVNGCSRTGEKGAGTAAGTAEKTDGRKVGASVGMKAPDFTLKDMNGKEFTLSKDAGNKPVLVNFWASWCVVCKDEIPILNSIYDEFKGSGIVFAAVNYMDNAKKVARFLKTTPVKFPVLMDEKGDVAEKLYGIEGLPVTILIDSRGTVVYNASEPPGKKQLAQLLKSKPGKPRKEVVERNGQTKFGLDTGRPAPDFTVKTDTGTTFHLMEVLKKGPVVLVFYRGGWCPYCQTQIRELQKNAGAFRERGATLAALSVDQAVYARETSAKEKLGFPLLSDPDAGVLGKYHLRLEVDDATLEKYKEYGIDLEKASGRAHHIIAVPAVFVIDGQGIIRWAYVNEDYKVRAKIADILKALDGIRK